MARKELRLEGSGPSKLKQAIKHVGHNVEVDVQFATVVSAPPDLKIVIDNDPIEYDRDDLLLAEHLTAHKRTFKLTPSTIQAVLSSAGSPSHTHNLTTLNLTGEIEFTDELKVGDRLLVAAIFDGQTIYIMDKVVKF